MSIEENKRVMSRVIEEGFNKMNLDALDDLFAPDYIENQFGLHITLTGLKDDIRFLHEKFPDFHITVEEMVADGDKVWARATCRGTNRGGFMGPPNGKSYTTTVFDEVRIQDGKIVEHWGVPDRFAMLAQLGLLPQPQGQGA